MVLAYGNDCAGFGAKGVGRGIEAFGGSNTTDGEVAAVGMKTSLFGGFDEGGSGSIGGSTDFYGVLDNGISSVFTNRVRLDAFECAQLVMTEVSGSSSANLLGLLVAGGRTLQTDVGFFTLTATGSVAVTGLGFQPQLIFFFSRGRTGFGTPVVTPSERAIMMFGATDGVNQWAHSTKSRYLEGAGTAGNRQRNFTNAACISVIGNPTVASITSMDADGFTVNVTAQDDDIDILYIAFYDPGGSFSVGDGVEGDTSIAVGFDAEAIFFGSAGTTDTATHDDEAICIGCATPDLERAGWAGAQTGGVVDSYWADAALSITVDGGGNDAEASVTAWNPTDVDLSWTTGGGGGNLFGWAAMLLSNGVGFENCGGSLPQVYRYDTP